MSNYIDDAGAGGGERSDSYLGSPDAIFHGQNDEYTQKLDAKMIEKLTPAERLKMGAEAGPAPRVKVEYDRDKMEEAERRAAHGMVIPGVRPLPVPRPFWCWNPTGIALLIILAFALLVTAVVIHGGPLLPLGNPRGNSPEIPVKSPIPAPCPAPNHP